MTTPIPPPIQRMIDMGRPLPPALAARFGIGQDPPPAPTVQQLLDYAAAVRYRKEIGGITVNGLSVPTDDRAKLLIMGAANLADDQTAPYVYDDVVTQLTGAQFKALLEAIISHVQHCFSEQATAIAAINAQPPTITTKAQVDAAFA